MRALLFWMLARVIPTGAAIDYCGTAAPNGAWLVFDGSAVSRTTYAALFAVIGTTYGAGDGSTTFNLPDCRGRVVVYLGTNASVSSLNLNDGQAVANRRPQHRTTNSLSLSNTLGLSDLGHTHTLSNPGTEGSGFANAFQAGTNASTFQTNAGAPSVVANTTGISLTGSVSLTGSIGTNNSNDALDTPSYIVLGVKIGKT